MELRTSNVVHRVYISLSPTGHEAAGGEILMSMHVARKRVVTIEWSSTNSKLSDAGTLGELSVSPYEKIIICCCTDLHVCTSSNSRLIFFFSNKACSGVIKATGRQNQLASQKKDYKSLQKEQ